MPRSHRRSYPVARVAAVILLAVALLALQSAASPASAQGSAAAPDFTLHLVGRQFVPPPGLEQRLVEHMRLTGRARVHGLVQLESVADPVTLAALEARGVRLLTYIPHNAWLASMPANPLAVRDVPGVRALLHLALVDKLSPGLPDGAVPPWARRASGAAALWVTFHADVPMAEARSRLTQLGASITDEWPESHRLEVEIAPRAIRELAHEDIVAWLSETPPPKTTANDGARYNMGLVELQGAALDGPLGGGVLVGEWDEGRVGTHQDLPAERVEVVDTAAAVSDHATHVAGSVLGMGNLVARARGMAPAARLFSYDWNNPVAEHQDAAARGVDLSTNSWVYGASKAGNSCYGAYTYDAPDFDDIVRGRYGREILVLFAAGNSQQTKDPCSRSTWGKIHVPATAKNIVTVGAIHSDDSTMTTFSSWGPTADGRVKPEVVAPGCERGGERGIYSTLPNDGYAAWCGTSMATPVTTGAAAVLYGHWRHLTFGDAGAGQTMAPASLKALLVATARDLGNPGPDFKHGFGAVDALAAKSALDDGRALVEEGEGLGHGQQREHAVTAAGGPLHVALVWSDVPAAVNASKTLVNDLDLVLIGPDGAPSVLPWVLDPAKPDATATRGTDRTNVVELVTVADAPPGSLWTARVGGAAVPVGPQPYAIALRGGSFATAHDLAVSALEAPTVAAVGFEYDLHVTVANQGTLDEEAAEVVLVDVTTNAELGRGTIFLASGETARLSFAWQPAEPTGARVLRAEVVPVDGEANVENNSMDVDVLVRAPIRDVAVTGVIAAPNPVSPGTPVEIAVRVANVGDFNFGDDDVALAVARSVDSGSSEEIGSETLALAVGQETERLFTWSTDGAAPGDVVIVATVSAADDDATNDVSETTVTVVDTLELWLQVTAGADDVDTGCSFRADRNEVNIGMDDSCRGNRLYAAGFRFQDVPIPNGATVNSAFLEFTSASNYSYAVQTLIVGEAADHAQPFSASHEPKSLTRTSAGVSWDISEFWPYQSEPRTPDLSPVIQEIVNRAGWSQYNALALVVDTTGAKRASAPHRRFFAVERGANGCPTAGSGGHCGARLFLEYAP